MPNIKLLPFFYQLSTKLNKQQYHITISLSLTLPDSSYIDSSNSAAARSTFTILQVPSILKTIETLCYKDTSKYNISAIERVSHSLLFRKLPVINYTSTVLLR